MASAAMLARKFDLPVVPVNMQARNSALFYLFDLVHPTLRDITLFHETLNKARQPFAVSIARPIPAAALPAAAAEATAMLRHATLRMGAPDIRPVLARRGTWQALLGSTKRRA
jgi:putative hemolysin